MDVILDDGDHYPLTQLRTLTLWWPYVRPGGYYIIEDVATGANSHNQQRYRGLLDAPGYSQLAHNQSFWDLSDGAREIFFEHDVFFVDSLVGHRAFALWQRRNELDYGPYMKDSVSHNSHVIVIRKRAVPRTQRARPIEVFRGQSAMRHGWVARGARMRAVAEAGADSAASVNRRQ